MEGLPSQPTKMNEKEPINIEHAAAPSFIHRCLSILYDSLLVFGLLLLGSILVTLPLGLITGMETTKTLPQHPLFRIWLGSIPAAFFIHFWLKGGQTLGMRTWRLMVIRDDGYPLQAKDAIIRFLAAILSLGALGLGFIWILIDREGLSWHDRISKTRLIQLEKKS